MRRWNFPGGFQWVLDMKVSRKEGFSRAWLYGPEQERPWHIAWATAILHGWVRGSREREQSE